MQPTGYHNFIKWSGWVSAILLLIFLGVACAEEDQSKIDKKPIPVDNMEIELQISGTWKYTAIIDSAGKAVKEVAAGDQMLLDYPEQGFAYGLSKEKLTQKGKWAIKDGKLVLTYELSAEEAKKLPKERTFAVATINDSTLKLVENGITYAFKR